jgi:hypothetical protein
MQRPSHVGEQAPINMSRLDSRSDISLKIRDQTGRVRVPAVGAVAQALRSPAKPPMNFLTIRGQYP